MRGDVLFLVYAPVTIPEEIIGIVFVKVIPKSPDNRMRKFGDACKDSYQFLEGFALIFAFSSSETGRECCLAIAAATISS